MTKSVSLNCSEKEYLKLEKIVSDSDLSEGMSELKAAFSTAKMSSTDPDFNWLEVQTASSNSVPTSFHYQYLNDLNNSCLLYTSYLDDLETSLQEDGF